MVLIILGDMSTPSSPPAAATASTSSSSTATSTAASQGASVEEPSLLPKEDTIPPFAAEELSVPALKKRIHAAMVTQLQAQLALDAAKEHMATVAHSKLGRNSSVKQREAYRKKRSAAFFEAREAAKSASITLTRAKATHAAFLATLDTLIALERKTPFR